MTQDQLRQGRAALLTTEAAFISFLMPLLAGGWLLAHLTFSTAASTAIAGALLGCVVVTLIRRFAPRSDDVATESNRSNDVGAQDWSEGEEEEQTTSTLLGKLRFYSWALPLVATALVVGWVLTFFVPLVIVVIYMVAADHATPARTVTAVALTIAGVALNEKLLIEPLANRWGIPRN